MTSRRFGRLTDAPTSLHLAGVRIVDPGRDIDRIGDLAIHDGRIVEPHRLPDGAERFDATGLVAAPGLCDLHAHLREPGTDGAETVETGARSAARGGYTTICAMPNTDPPLDRLDRVREVVEAARDAACRVRVVAAASMGRAGIEPVDLGALAPAVVGFSDDGAAVGDAPARATFERLAAVGLPLFEHPEDPGRAGGGVMRAGPVAARLGLAGWPPTAELAVVERDLGLARDTGARIHLTHLSTAESIVAVCRARAEGVAVTCDVTPHHLALTDAWVAGSRAFAWDEPDVDPVLAYDGRCRVNPPLASSDDARALLGAVADGTVDAIATDHAPHPANRKLVPFAEAAPGLIGLETALSLGLAAVDAGGLSLVALLAALSTRPGAIIGEARSLAPGSVADVVVFDPSATWEVEAGSLASASANTPLLGRRLPGVVRLTVAAGRVTYRS